MIAMVALFVTAMFFYGVGSLMERLEWRSRRKALERARAEIERRKALERARR